MAKTFDLKTYRWKAEIDYQQHPEAYRVGKGEQGVLICEPYKSALVSHWRFKTEEIAKQSSTQLLKFFYEYLEKGDFVGADLTRKFLQMGFTRSRRYANYKGGKKYKNLDKTDCYEKGTGDPEKIKSAAIFYQAWQTAEKNPIYAKQKAKWLAKYG